METVRELYEPIYSEAIRRGYLVNFTIEEITINNELRTVLKIDTVDPIVDFTNFSRNQYIEVRSFIAEFCVFLLNRGYALIDPHGGNIIISKVGIKYIDIGSIVPVNEGYMKQIELFNVTWVNPYKYINKKGYEFQTLFYYPMEQEDYVKKCYGTMGVFIYKIYFSLQSMFLEDNYYGGSKIMDLIYKIINPKHRNYRNKNIPKRIKIYESYITDKRI